MCFVHRIIMAVLLVSVSACGSYSEVGHELARKYDLLFVESAICRDINDCRKRELVLVGGGKGAVLNFYEASRHPKEIVQKIIATSLDVEEKRVELITLSFYTLSKKEINKSFLGLGHKPFLVVEIKGGY